MGYNTDFKGTLKFKREPKAAELALLKTFLGKDIRELDIEKTDEDYWCHIDLELTKDFLGIRWNGAEKTYGMDSIINFITKQMRKEFPEFELIGRMKAQGEEVGDFWEIIMENGKAIRKEMKVVGEKIKCPHCDECFTLKDEEVEE